MPHSFNTEWPLFLAVILGYLAITLIIGGKFFFVRSEEPKDE